MTAGRLLGIARHDRPRGAIETIDRVRVSVEAGIAGDFRGAAKPGGKRKRQVTVMTLADWTAAMSDLGAALEWHVRRVNLLVDGIDLPRAPGALIRIGASMALEVTGECDPCSRMEEIAPGLKAVLMPEWRGGRITRVWADGDIAVGDPVIIERTGAEAA